MTLYDIKPRFQDLLRPLTRKLHAWGITANQVTTFAALSSLCFGLLLMLFPLPGLFIFLPLFLFVRMVVLFKGNNFTYREVFVIY